MQILNEESSIGKKVRSDEYHWQLSLPIFISILPYTYACTHARTHAGTFLPALLNKEHTHTFIYIHMHTYLSTHTYRNAS